MAEIILDESPSSKLLKSKMSKQKYTTNVSIRNIDQGFDYIAINCGYALRLSKELIEKLFDEDRYYNDPIPFELVFIHGADYRHYYEHREFIHKTIEYVDGGEELYDKLIKSTNLSFDTLFRANKEYSDKLSWSDFITITNTLIKCNHCAFFCFENMYNVRIITIDNMKILSVDFDTESG